MSFSTNEVVEVSKSAGGTGKYLKPGIQIATINTIEGVTPEQGSPYIEIGFFKFGESEEFQTKVRFYMSEKGIARSLEKIKHIGTKVVEAAVIDSIKAETLEEYGSKLQNLLTGNSLRLKFVGEEYVNAKGETKVKTTIGLPTFAEATQKGAEYPVVEDKDTKLKYDENNTYDMKRLEKVSTTATGSESTGKLGW